MTTRPKSRLRAYLLRGAIVGALAAALIVCALMVDSINRRMNESATSNLLNTTQVIADTLEGVIAKDYDALRAVGAMFVNSSDAPTADQLLTLCDTLELDWLGIVNAAGRGTDCFGTSFLLDDHPGAAGWDLQNEGYSDAYVGQRSGRPQITLWSPIYRDGVYCGAVMGNVILTQYYAASLFTFYGGEGRTYLFRGSDGGLILKSMGGDGAATLQEDIYSLLSSSNNRPEDVEAVRKMVEDGLPGTASLRFNGERSYLCFMPLRSSPGWYVTTVIARDTLLREASEVRRMISLMLVILGLTLAGSAIVFAVWRVRQTRSEEARYRETLFANLSANLDSAFLIYDKGGQKPVFVSDNIKRLLGLQRAWVGEDTARLFDWCGIAADDPQRIAFLSGTLDQAAVREVTVEDELGQAVRTVRLELIPADLGQQLAVLTDITGDKQIQRSLVEALERAEAAGHAKNDFLSAMSHDLRTPINGIVGMTAIAAAHLDDQNRVRDCLGKISESTAHLLGLINEVLDMAQIESGKLELSSEAFNLPELLQSVLNVNYPGIQQNGHDVRVRIHLMEHEDVIGDSARLTRITTNLLSNAIKYTPAGGQITLTLREKPAMIQGYGCYELSVQDNGIGMSESFQQKLFEPFEREEDVRLRRIQGTGLGLSIVKSMVELMMGSIQVESEKGVGTTFHVTLNLRLDEQQAGDADRLAGLPVLVVDDDEPTCQTVTDILCSIGMAGEWVSSGADAVERVSDRHRRGDDFHAVLLDWKMPDMDGVETARRIRACVGRALPIIILTAYDWGEIEADARAAGVDAFLSKPIYRAKLVQNLIELTVGQTPLLEPSTLQAAAHAIPPGKRVLLAEDNELNKEIAIELLRMLGVATDCVDNGADAVDRFAASPPGTYDLILMDIQMPRMNGYDATRAIRSLSRPDGRTVPIVAMTADAFKKDEQSARAAGMNEHLAKPISVERLTQVLTRYLAGPPNR